VNGRGHSVVVLARGHILAMEQGKAVYIGGRTGAWGVPWSSSPWMPTQVNVPADASERQMG
jgi:hypothetical protein